MLYVEGEDARVDPSIMRDDRMRERGVGAPDGTKVDHGGYEAAAVAFQQSLAHSGAAPPAAAMASQLTDFNDDDLDWD